MVRRLLLVALLLLIVWMGIKGWRILRAVQSLQTQQATIEDLDAEGLASIEPETVETLVSELRSDVVTLRRETAIFIPLTPLFAWLPEVGPVLRDASLLMDMADAGTEAAAYSLRALKPALTFFQEDESSDALITRMLPILEEGRPDLVRASAALDRVTSARAQLRDVEQYPWRLRTLIEEADSKLYLTDYLKFLTVAPTFLGADGQRTYLVLAQNEDEIRPTGGFLTGAGLMTIDNGRIEELSFLDANLVDAWESRNALGKPYGDPPEPLRQLMGLDLFLFRDSNFWPDFPTSAEQAFALYRYGQDARPLDGAIAVDQRFLSLLLSAVGPVSVSELEATVTENNILTIMREAWGPDISEARREWVRNRKDFLGPLAEAIRDRVFSDFGSLDPLFLAEKLDQALRQKHLQIYTRDPAVAAVLDELDWDGRLESRANEDWLMVVDTNVGYNKSNPFVESTLNYELFLGENGGAVADVTLHYTHNYDQPIACEQGTVYDDTPAYSDVMRRCFWNFVRLYVPAGSQLLDSTTHSYPDSLFSFSKGWDGGGHVVNNDPVAETVFANFLIVAPGETVESHFRYELLPVVTEEGRMRKYSLSLLRQAGIAPRSVEIVINLPESAHLVSSTPAPTESDPSRVTFKTILESDQQFTIIYRD